MREAKDSGQSKSGAQKLPTYMAFLDISKAFDTLDRDKLFCHLWEKGVQGKCWRLLKSLYSTVQSKVLFGPVESGWFSIDNGVKQGCVLSPTLFSLLMCDLTDMLACENIGIEYREKTLPALLFADDIVLMAPGETQLEEMLATAARFSLKWGLRFNENKSKVMVVGKRINKDKTWKLGDMHLSETNVYKYLGVFISRTLKDTYHIKTHLKEKGKKLKGLIINTLGKHLNVNRVDFGNVLWHNVARSALAHGCCTWFEANESLRSTVQSLQYQIGQAVLNLRKSCKPAKEALLGDLGWLPLSHFVDCQRIKYVSYLLALPTDRLPRQILQDMLAAHHGGERLVWPAIEHICNTLRDKGLDDALSGPTENLPGVFSKLSSELYQNRFREALNQRSSLRSYRHFKYHSFREKYTHDMSNFQGIKLKFKARSGVLELETLKEKWGLSNDGMCKLCNNEKETLCHFMFHCCALNGIRTQVFNCLESKLMNTEYAHVWYSFCASSAVHKMNMLIGECAYMYGEDIGLCFDQLCKVYLTSAWEERRKLLSSARN
jgi:hypothetical protein